MTTSLQRRQALVTLASLVTAAMPLRAQAAWPDKPLRFVVPAPAGGTPDRFTRLIAEFMSRQLGVPASVENKPGASGLLGLRAVSQRPADNHLFVLVNSGHVTLAALKSGFDLLHELRPVARLSASPFVVVVKADSPIRSLDALIARVQASPGRISYGTGGPGSPTHMAVEYLAEATKNFDALHVQFKGSVDSMQAVLGGHIDFTFSVLGTALPQIRAGTLRALGVTSSRRVPVLAEVPTIAEVVGSDYAYQSWGGFMMHARTPDAVVARAAAAMAEAMRSDAMRRFVADAGLLVDMSESPAAFEVQLTREIAAEKAIVRRLGITLE